MLGLEQLANLADFHLFDTHEHQEKMDSGREYAARLSDSLFDPGVTAQSNFLNQDQLVYSFDGLRADQASAAPGSLFIWSSSPTLHSSIYYPAFAFNNLR